MITFLLIISTVFNLGCVPLNASNICEHRLSLFNLINDKDEMILRPVTSRWCRAQHRRKMLVAYRSCCVKLVSLYKATISCTTITLIRFLFECQKCYVCNTHCKSYYIVYYYLYLQLLLFKLNNFLIYCLYYNHDFSKQKYT